MPTQEFELGDVKVAVERPEGCPPFDVDLLVHSHSAPEEERERAAGALRMTGQQIHYREGSAWLSRDVHVGGSRLKAVVWFIDGERATRG